MRSQHTNRGLAPLRLAETLEPMYAAKRQARLTANSQTRRQRARQSRATKAKLVEGKHRHGETKRLRGKIHD